MGASGSGALTRGPHQPRRAGTGQGAQFMRRRAESRRRGAGREPEAPGPALRPTERTRRPGPTHGRGHRRRTDAAGGGTVPRPPVDGGVRVPEQVREVERPGGPPCPRRHRTYPAAPPVRGPRPCPVRWGPGRACNGWRRAGHFLVMTVAEEGRAWRVGEVHRRDAGGWRSCTRPMPTG